MAAPTTIQEGQGLAQIFQGNMAADVYAYQQQLRAQQDAERAKKADLAAKELSGQFEALNKKNIFETRDTDEFRSKIDQVRNKYSGKWEELYKGDTPLRRDLEKDLLDVSLWADQSASSKKELQGIWKDAFQDNADKYTDQQRAKIEELMVTPGAFKVPYKELIPFENIDLEKAFMDLSYKPAAQEAADRFTSDNSWRGLQNYGSIKQTKLPEESVESHWAQFINDPKVQNALYHKYGAEAEAAGMDLIEYVKQNTPYYDRLKINKKQTASGLIKDSGEDKVFDPNNFSDINRATEYMPDLKGKIYNINYPVTIQTGNLAFDWSNGERMPKGWAGTGSVVGLTMVPIKNNAIDQSGTKRPYAIVSDEKGNAIVIPAEQVISQGKAKGYDMDNIINGVVQVNTSSQPSLPTATMSEWKKAGWTEEQVKTAVSQGKIKLK